MKVCVDFVVALLLAQDFTEMQMYYTSKDWKELARNAVRMN